MSNAPAIRLGRPDVGEAELAEVAAVFETGMLTTGPKVAEFEAELARICEVEHAVAVSSGTAALHLAVLALGLEPGDEVIVPAYTFPATGNVVALAGLRPVLTDVDPETMNLDPSRVVIGPRTRAILGVHLFGRPLSVEELPGEVTLFEDAAGALGARSKGRACGSLGIAGCLTLVLTAEMFNQALKALTAAGDRQSTPQVQRALAIGTAAVVVSCAGSTVILTLIFWQRCQQLFAG